MSVLKKVLIGCGALIFLSTIAVVIVSYYGYTKLKEGYSQDPVHVEEVARSIMDYEFPESKGLGSVEFGFKGAMLVDKLEQPGTMLILLSFPSSWPDYVVKNIQEESHKVTSESPEHIEVKSVTKEERMLCDQKVEVVITEGTTKNAEQQLPVTFLQTSLTHKDNLLVPFVMAASDNSKEKAESIFNSLKCKE